MPRYAAGRRLKFPGGVVLEGGDPIDDETIKGWRNLQAWISSGHVVLLKDKGSDPLQILRDALAETRDDASSHTKTKLLELAAAAGVGRPDPVPRLKVELIEELEGGL